MKKCRCGNMVPKIPCVECLSAGFTASVVDTFAILKYPFDGVSAMTLRLPKDARVLSVGLQNGVVCLWIVVNTKAPCTQKRVFDIMGTGWKMSHVPSKFLGTVIDEMNALVWHVFETTPL